MKEQLEAGANSWLALTGQHATYRWKDTGQTVMTMATLELNVETVDDHGMINPGTVITVDPTKVPRSVRGDEIDMGANGTFRVDELLDTGGYLLRLLVTKL